MEFGLTTMELEEYYKDNEILELYAGAGFKYIDYYFARYNLGSEFEKEEEASLIDYFTKLKAKADSLNVTFFQTHAPYPTVSTNNEIYNAIFNNIVKSIQAASILGAKYIVIHPLMNYYYHYDIMKPYRKSVNMRFYRKLLPYLEKYNMICGIENMFCRRRSDKKLIATTCSKAEEMLDYLATLNSPRFTMCADIGHANIIYKDSGIEMLTKLGDNLGIVHLHDNFDICDDHFHPGIGNIDWTKVTDTLKKINFKGVMNLECHASVTKNAKQNIKTNLAEIMESAQKYLNTDNVKA